MNHSSLRMPGEFERHRGTILIWPTRPGSWGVDPRAAQRAFCRIMEELLPGEEVFLLADRAHRREAEAMAPKGVQLLEIETDDAWARDTGPTFVYRQGRGRAGESETDEDASSPQRRASGLRDSSVLQRKEEAGMDESMLVLGAASAEASQVYEQGLGKEAELLGIDWAFNAWGGSYDGLYQHYERDDQVAKRVCEALHYGCIDAHPFLLEGGSIHSDGEGTILTTESCLLSPGRNADLTKQGIEEKLMHYLGGEKVLWLPRGIYHDETNEHVDNVCAFVRPGEVVLAWTEEEEDPQYELSHQCYQYLSGERDARGRALKIHKLPIPRKPICITEADLLGYEFEEGEDRRELGERLAASYVNFYIGNEVVLAPAFGDVKDGTAERLLSACFPERRVVMLPARDILLGGGNIHCITQQIPADDRGE